MFVFCLPGETELNISQNKSFFFSLFGPDYFKILHKLQTYIHSKLVVCVVSDCSVSTQFLILNERVPTQQTGTSIISDNSH